MCHYRDHSNAPPPPDSEWPSTEPPWVVLAEFAIVLAFVTATAIIATWFTT